MTPRRFGLLASLVLAGVLLLILLMSFGPNRPVVPTNGVTAGGKADNPGGDVKLSDLQARTRLQLWPETGESARTRPSLALGPTEKPPGSPRTGEQRVQEWRGDLEAHREILQQPTYREGVSTLPAPVSGVLVQPQGRTWRDIRNDTISYGGGLYVVGLSLLIALFLAWRGRVPVKNGESGELIKRFNAFERANHWLTAVSFLLMALTGLVILYGNGLIRPWLGASAYADLARLSAWSHATFAVPFVIGVLIMMALWMRPNRFEGLDWHWLKRGGGLLSDRHENPPARKFNAGQKLVFWAVVLGGLFLALTGFVLMFPFIAAGYLTMQVAQVLHAAAGLLMIGVIIGHIYIGSIGMVGAFDAMWSGRVDRNWAKEHHELWYRESAQAVPSRQRRSLRTAGALASFAGGVALAVVLAMAMVSFYEASAIGTSDRKAVSVHLDEDVQSKKH
jgi:formate dehydrogenase subunit gamma